MNAKLNPLRLSIVSALLASSLAVPQAHAGDAKLYPGSMGVRFGGANPSYNFSTIGNPSSTEWMYLDLPAINDHMSEDVNNTWVRVLDRHYSSDIRCSFNTAYWNNTTDSFYGWWGANKYSIGSGNDAQILYTGGTGGAGSAYHHYFSCRIPPAYAGNRSYIVSYYVNED
jgi:hypothetical protein